MNGIVRGPFNSVDDVGGETGRRQDRKLPISGKRAAWSQNYGQATKYNDWADTPTHYSPSQCFDQDSVWIVPGEDLK